MSNKTIEEILEIIDECEAATVDATAAAATASDPVAYTAQSKTSAEKTQARCNIGAFGYSISGTTLTIS